MKSAAFNYHRPDTLADAVGLLAELGDEAKAIAGGQSLVPMLAMRLSIFEHLVDIGRLSEMKGIERREGHVWVGGGTTEAAVEHDPMVATDVPLLARATPLIGHVQIRNRGTVGGSVAHADPAAEYPAVVLALGAELEAVSASGGRTIAADQFFTGLWSTSLDSAELLSGIRFPVWSGRCGFAVEEFARRHGDFAIAGAAVAIQIDGDDKVSRCGIGLFGLGATPRRAVAAEQAVAGRTLGEIAAGEIGQLAVGDLEDIPHDLNGSAAYRRRVGTEMVARAWRSASAEASAS